jgi:hypothetical protein
MGTHSLRRCWRTRMSRLRSLDLLAIIRTLRFSSLILSLFACRDPRSSQTNDAPPYARAAALGVQEIRVFF